MISFDIDYLKRIESHADTAALLREPAFLRTQELFFAVVHELGGAVDFDIADMREVHAVVALSENLQNIRVLDIGCGSTETYVLQEKDFRNRYPPFFAQMLTKLGVNVTGIDIRANPTASYDHRVVDVTQTTWLEKVEPPYDIVTCFSLFNAPHSAFEHDVALCNRLMQDIHTLLAPGGLLIATVRDDLFADNPSKENRWKHAAAYAEEYGFSLEYCSGNCVWARKNKTH